MAVSCLIPVTMPVLLSRLFHHTFVPTSHLLAQVSELFLEADWEGNGSIDSKEFESVMLRAYRASRSAGMGMVSTTPLEEVRCWARASMIGC